MQCYSISEGTADSVGVKQRLLYAIEIKISFTGNFLPPLSLPGKVKGKDNYPRHYPLLVNAVSSFENGFVQDFLKTFCLDGGRQT